MVRETKEHRRWKSVATARRLFARCLQVLPVAPTIVVIDQFLLSLLSARLCYSEGLIDSDIMQYLCNSAWPPDGQGIYDSRLT
jgi:hypothetical protein